MGDSKTPLVFITIACISNVLLDLFFIGALKMGAIGAAYANIIAQTLSLVISIVYLKRNKFVFDFRPRSFIPYKDKTVAILKIGLPLAVMETIINISFLMINAIVNRLGVIPSAAIGVAGRFDVFAMLISTAMSMSIAAMVGQNIGAGQYERAKKVLKVGIQISMVFAGVLFIWAQISPGSIMMILLVIKRLLPQDHNISAQQALNLLW
jgi:Na+-driven multidrug efflux pump